MTLKQREQRISLTRYYKLNFFVRLLRKFLNFVFLRRKMYDGTSTEQKTKNAKSAVSSILTALFKPYRQHFVLPPPFINKRRQIGWMYLAWFRGFIGSLKSPPKITEDLTNHIHLIRALNSSSMALSVRFVVRPSSIVTTLSSSRKMMMCE